MGIFVDLSGERFGKLVVIQRASNVGTATRWLCRCDCGNEKIIRHRNLGANTNSCGCIRNTQKGLTRKHPLWSCWQGMLIRCGDFNNKTYGGKGIKVCWRWHSFPNFLEDMEDTFFKGASIERKDNNKGYNSRNCIWIPLAKQARNTKKNRYIETPLGRMLAAEAAEKFGIKSYIILDRINRGWPMHQVFLPEKFHRYRSPRCEE